MLHLLEEDSNQLPTQQQLYSLTSRWYPALRMQSSFSRTIRRLRVSGLIDMQMSERDRRFNTVKLTAHGKRVVGEIKKQREAILRLLTEGLTKRERETFYNALELIGARAWAILRRIQE